MTLRARLSLVILLVVLLPLTVGALVVGLVVPDVLRDRVAARLDRTGAAVSTVLAERCARLGAAGESAAVAASTQGVGAALDVVRARHEADYLAVLGPDGAVRGETGRPVAGGTSGLSSCSRSSGEGGTTAALAERVPLTGSGASGGEVVVAFRLDDAALRRLAGALRVEAGLTVARDGSVVVSTLGAGEAGRIAASLPTGGGRVETGDLLGSVVQPAPGSPFTVVVTEPRPSSGWLAPVGVAAAVVAAALAALFGWLLARDLARPLEELTEGAERFARGELEGAIPVRSDDEVGRLAVAFNRMTGQVRAQLDELARSRDALSANLDRVGDALARTHDLDGILDVVLETAMTAVGAGAGGVYRSSPDRVLRLRAGRDHSDGQAALPHEIPEEMRDQLRDEAPAGTVLTAPLRRAGQDIGLLVLLALPDEGGDRRFTDGDEDTIRTLAGQASVAIDNVLLHEEAQRLSITDGLTGLWNYRYLSMSLNRELDRAERFGRPVAVLMLDLDNFKTVNDTYGHQRGDAVLRELARRVTEQIREVDTFARYGGEEFALVLPETDADGAGMVAARVKDAVGRAPFGGERGEDPVTLTVSVGVALSPQHGRSPASLLRAADAALYEAKRAGRNRWRMAVGEIVGPAADDPGRPDPSSSEPGPGVTEAVPVDVPPWAGESGFPR